MTKGIEVGDGVLGEDFTLITLSQVDALRELSPTAVQMFLRIAIVAGRRRWFFPGGMGEIAQLVPASVRSCWRALAELERAGLLHVETRKKANGSDLSHRYTVTRPTAAGPVAVPRVRKAGAVDRTASKRDDDADGLQLQLAADEVFHNPRTRPDSPVTPGPDSPVTPGPDSPVTPQGLTLLSPPPEQSEDQLDDQGDLSIVTLPAAENRPVPVGQPVGRVIRLDGRPRPAEGATQLQLRIAVEAARRAQLARLQDGPQLSASEATPALARSLQAFQGAAERWLDVRALDLHDFLPCPSHVMLIAFCDCGAVQTWGGSGDVCKRCGSAALDVRRSEAAVAAGVHREAQAWTEGAFVPSARVLLDAAGVTRGRHRGILGRWLSERIGSVAAALDAGVSRDAGSDRAAYRRRA